jgi:glyoxylase-like metal-dependent hydrolase (beta-lactamase superfamily II)
MNFPSHIFVLLGLIFELMPFSITRAADLNSIQDNSKLYACFYGSSPFRESFAFSDGKKDASINIAWSFYVLKTGSNVTLIDTGFSDENLASKWKLKDFTKPERLLESLSIDPVKVNRVVITHLHFDHLNNLPLFTHAQVVISRQDRDDYLAKKPSGGMVYNEAVAVVLRDDTRTHVVDKMETLEGGLIFEVIGGHTRGSSVVRFSHAGTRYVLTGDECYLCANAREQRAIGVAFNRQANAAFLASIADLATVILPCHDPIIFTKFPSVKPNVVRIF